MRTATRFRIRIRFIIAASTAIVMLAASGCRSARRGEPIAGRFNTSDPKVAKGLVLYMQHCHQCHPGGEGGLGPGINDKPFPEFLMKTQVRLGLGVMPGFDRHQLGPEELDDLMAYISARRKHGS